MTVWETLEYVAALAVTAPLLVLIFCVIVLYIWDISQKKHTVLRNYPIIGHLRYFFERQGEQLRQYFFSGDREEMPFDRATRSWIYRMSKGQDQAIAFGSSYPLLREGSIVFSNALFPVQEEEAQPTPDVVIGDGFCAHPLTTRSLINISGMSYGALSKPAVQALSRAAHEAGCWMDTGEGGVSPYHLEGGGHLIAQIGTGFYGFRTAKGEFSWEALVQVNQQPAVRAFEIKLSQGAKPGKGGLLLANKITKEIAAIRGIEENQNSISPNRHPHIHSADDLLDWIARIRETTQKPVGIKTALGSYDFLVEFFSLIQRRGLQDAPDFLVIDGGEGGTGAAPQALMDYVGLSIREALPIVVDLLYQFSLKERIVLIASGKLVTPADVAWALCMGADFVNTARGFLFSLGCIQAMRCHTNRCPTGITTHNRWLQRGLVVSEKYLRAANYAKNINREVEEMAHSCGLLHPRLFRRNHVRLVEHGRSMSYAELFPQSHVSVMDTGQTSG